MATQTLAGAALYQLRDRGLQQAAEESQGHFKDHRAAQMGMSETLGVDDSGDQSA
jgi:hypothetical protein